VDILHPVEHTNGKEKSVEQDEDEMEVDEDDALSGGAIEDDSIQEQLAMEMGHHASDQR
jgi:hypothetical protein